MSLFLQTWSEIKDRLSASNLKNVVEVTITRTHDEDSSGVAETTTIVFEGCGKCHKVVVAVAVVVVVVVMVDSSYSKLL